MVQEGGGGPGREFINRQLRASLYPSDGFYRRAADFVHKSLVMPDSTFNNHLPDVIKIGRRWLMGGRTTDLCTSYNFPTRSGQNDQIVQLRVSEVVNASALYRARLKGAPPVV